MPQEVLSRSRVIKCPRRNERIPLEKYNRSYYNEVINTANCLIVDSLNDKKSLAVAALGKKGFQELICIPQPHMVESYILPGKTVRLFF